MKKRELKFQSHIVAAYKAHGGQAMKWASEWVAGPPDLVASLPGIGVHLVEVKHMPQMSVHNPRHYKNPMTVKQRHTAKRYIEAGGIVRLAVVANGTAAPETFLGFFNPLEERIQHPLSGWSPYVPGKGYSLTLILKGLFND